VKPITVTEQVHAPPGATFAVFTDFANCAGRIPGILKIEVLTPGPVKRGTKFQETRKMFGKQATETMEVTAYEPPRRYVLSAVSGGVAFDSEFRFLSEKGGTQVDFTMTTKAQTLFAKLMAPIGWLMRRSLLKCLKRDVAALKAYVESQPATA
jgi:carbon monoxide dehydrogenase subunit G